MAEYYDLTIGVDFGHGEAAGDAQKGVEDSRHASCERDDTRGYSLRIWTEVSNGNRRFEPPFSPLAAWKQSERTIELTVNLKPSSVHAR